MTAAFTTGFLTGFVLILAIGAQNAFVLHQGLTRHHIFAVCLTCALSDAILIALGVAGFGSLITLFPGLPIFMRFAGAAFLVVYGALRLRAAWLGQSQLEAGAKSGSLRATVITCLMLTWLNPHVYLDTLALLGAVSTQYTGLSGKISFATGAIVASFTFFFSLGYGAKLMLPIMKSARAWQIMDTLVGLLMWALAAGLILST